MIVDLLRNDLSKCCDLNTVKVNKLFDIESLRQYIIWLALLTENLRHNISSIDLLASCFLEDQLLALKKKVYGCH